MRQFLTSLRKILKTSFDNIRNEKLRNNILQAVPFWLGSLITGLVAVGYAQIFSWGEELLLFLMNWNKWVIFLLAPSGFLLSWWLVKRFAPYAGGSGIPQVMAAVDLANPKENKKIIRLLSLKITLIKIVSSVALVIGGGAIGREGPTLQIAGSIFHRIYTLLPSWWPKISKKNMLMASAAAGLSAAFNTPLGGIVFTVEELSKTHINYFKTALFTAVIIAGLTAQSLAGSYLYLGYPKTQGITIMVAFPIIFVAAISGILGSQLARFILAIQNWKSKLKDDKSHIIFLLITSLILATLAFFVSEEILGSGKEIMDRVLFSDQKNEHWYVPLLRVIGPALSFSSGASGGIFAPSLSAGASIGSVIAGWIHLQPNETNVVILAGMVAFLTGMTRAPFTSAILVLEMTDRHSLIFYLMLAGMTSSIFSLMVNRHSFYEILKTNYLKKIRSS